MEINDKLLKQIDEVKYLTVDNAWRYRVILRFFYLQYEKIKYWMYKEDIFEELKKHDEFAEYTMDLMKQDLDALVEYKNLIPVQDTSRVSTVEEFKSKKFRYHLSDYSVEIERLTLKLENLFVENASLEPSLLERIRQELKKFHEMCTADDKKAGVWWSSLNSDFKRLNQNYQDYIRDLYSLKAEELMKTKEFLVFKDRFIEYLRDFIKGLQYNSSAIEEIIYGISEEEKRIVLDKVLAYEMSIPRLDNDIPAELLKENILGRWESLKEWFVGSSGQESEASKLLNITNDIIRKITRFANQIAESRNSMANRKEEYRKLCEMFMKCENIEEAHKLSAVSFGIFNTKHIKGNCDRSTESINSGIFEEEPFEFTIKPRIRAFREKSNRTPITDNKERKKEMLARIIAKREEEKHMMEGYINDGYIEFERLPKIPSYVRITLLRWLSKGINSANGTSKTEDGRVYRVEEPEDITRKCILDSEDGSFEMPCYRISFEMERLK